VLEPKMPWQNQDLAELYRVRDRLAAVGLSVEVDSGVSDEGDPWFIYQQSGTDTVVVHIARIDTEIHVINCITGRVYVGASFREVSDRMLEDAPMVLGSRLRRSANVVLHPSAFLTAFVAAAIMLLDAEANNPALAATADDDDQLPHAASDDLEAPVGDDDAISDVPSDAGNGILGTICHLRRLQRDAGPNNSSLGPNAPAVGQGGFLSDVPGTFVTLSLGASFFAGELLRLIRQETNAEGFEAGDWGDVDPLAFFGGTRDGSAIEIAGSQAGAAGSHPVLLKADLPDAIPQSAVLHGPGAVVAPVEAQASSVESASLRVNTAKTSDPAHEKAYSGKEHASVTPDAFVASDRAAQPQETAKGSPNPEAGRAAESPTESTTSATVSQTGDVSSVAASAPIEASQPTSKAASSIVESRLEKVVKLLVDRSDALDHDDAQDIILVAGDALAIDAETDPDVLDLGFEDTDNGSVHHRFEPVVRDFWSDALGSDAARDVVVLAAGRQDVVHYEAGRILTVEGFVLGEDLMAFADDATASAMFGHARQVGNDLVMGNGTDDLVRLVGVLGEQLPTVAHAEMSGTL